MKNTKRKSCHLRDRIFALVGVAGFEPTASWTRTALSRSAAPFPALSAHFCRIKYALCRTCLHPFRCHISAKSSKLWSNPKPAFQNPDQHCHSERSAAKPKNPSLASHSERSKESVPQPRVAAHIVRHGITFPAVKICDAVDKDYARVGLSLCQIQKRPCAFLDFFFD